MKLTFINSMFRTTILFYLHWNSKLGKFNYKMLFDVSKENFEDISVETIAITASFRNKNMLNMF